MTTFPSEDLRVSYVHRLGNLVLLSRKKNAEAQNYDFDKKKEKYFNSITGVAPFHLTTLVIAKDAWTPQVIEQQQKFLLNQLKDIWRLN